MAQVLERTQRLRQHLESLLRRDLAARRGAQVAVDEAALRRRVDDYYLPMFLWTEEVVAATQRRGNGDADSRCVVLGLSCPQGGGKTTVCNYLEEMMTHEGKTCAVMSLDDVYWSRAKQLEVAATNPGNPLLQYRGNPGTQDLAFLTEFIQEAKTSAQEILVPRYDKSMHSGRGDRAPRSEWVRKQGPLDVLIIEGWCMGFEALEPSSAELRSHSEHLKPVNAALHEYEQFYRELDGLVVIKIGDVDWVYKWREEPEQLLREAGKPAMTKDELRDFVDRYMPAYKLYLPGLYADPTAQSARAARGLWTPSSQVAAVPRLVMEINHARQPVTEPVEFNFASEVVRSQN